MEKKTQLHLNPDAEGLDNRVIMPSNLIEEHENSNNDLDQSY